MRHGTLPSLPIVAVVGAGDDEDDFALRRFAAHAQTRVTWPILRPSRASRLP